MQCARRGGPGQNVSRIALGCVGFWDPAPGFQEWTLPQDGALPYDQQAASTDAAAAVDPQLTDDEAAALEEHDVVRAAGVF